MKFVKKLTCLFLAIVMTMAMGITAFADETPATTSHKKTDTVSITISDPVEGHTYKVYQLLKGDVSELTQTEKDGATGTLSNVEVGQNAANKNATTVDSIMSALKDSNGNWLSNGELSAKGYTLIDTTTDPVASLTKGNKTVGNLNPGYYVIVDEYSASITGENVVYSRNMVTVLGDTTIKIKSETPEIDKNIIDNKKADNTTDDPNKALDYVENKGGKTDTAAIGDEIQFEITGTVPNYDGYTYYYYILNDTLSEGLTLVDTNNAGFTVTVGGTTLTRGTDYYVYKDGQSFQVAFENIKSYAVGAAISVKYNATVNEKAVIGTEANTNTVKLQYSNNPNNSEKKDKDGKPGTPEGSDVTGETPTYTTKTYVTELNLTKVDQDGMPLKGAEFELTGTNLNKVIIRTDYTFTENTNGSYYKLKDGTYTEKAPVETTYEADGTTVKVQGNTDKYESTTTKYSRTTTVGTTSTADADKKVTAYVNKNGFVTFTGLNAGSYTLHESKTPTGYNTVADIEFTISATESDHQDGETAGGNITWASNNSNVTVSNGTFYVTVVNNKGSLLPSTGGMGTTVLYVAGIALVVIAGVVVIARKRMA